MNFFEPKPLGNPQRIEEIRVLVRERLKLPEDVVVMVTELQCSEPGCPPLETVIAVLDHPGRPRQFKVHKAIMEISLTDIREVIEAT